MLKQKSFRSKKYRDWVKTLPCVICEGNSHEAHHIIGTGNLGGMGMKAPDTYVMPVCRMDHCLIHQDPTIAEEQWRWVAKTLARAVDEGILCIK